MLSKTSSRFFNLSLNSISKFYAADAQKFDFKDALNFRKLLTEEETMVIIPFLIIKNIVFIRSWNKPINLLRAN